MDPCQHLLEHTACADTSHAPVTAPPLLLLLLAATAGAAVAAAAAAGCAATYTKAQQNPMFIHGEGTHQTHFPPLPPSCRAFQSGCG
jgi:hypothetical protein